MRPALGNLWEAFAPTTGLLALMLAISACSEKESDTAVSPDPGSEPAEELLDLDADREALSGRWKQARWATSTDDKISALETLGYVGGSQEAGDRSNVTIYEQDRAFEGLNLVVSGHAPEALLMGMDGEILHRWRCSYRTAVPTNEVGKLEKALFHDFFRRAHLYENGDLLAIFEGHALIKLDAESKLLWTWQDPAHHDMEVDDQGHIWVLSRKAGILPRINRTEPVLEDFIVELDGDGNELRRVSVLQAFENSPFASMLDQMKHEGDVQHTNTLELVDERLAQRLPEVSVGDVLVSCLYTNTIAVISMKTEQVVWGRRGTWRWQHQPTVLENGNILLLDNKGGRPRLGRSRMLEIEPESGKFAWIYSGAEDNQFQTNTCGAGQRLPNGNTLITESDNGRALEVNREGQTVWEFLNPFRAGDDGELVATLFEVVRLPGDFPTDWLPDD